MKTVISDVSSEFKLPYWWVESVAIEYLNCREFAVRDEIWTFNFDLISKKDLTHALETKKVVVSSPITHYSQLNRGGLLKSFKNYFLGLDGDTDGFIIEGPVSPESFPGEVEFLDFWDPKLSFSEHFQVQDDGKFWQWKIADSIIVEGTPYSKWTSKEVDLAPINDMDAKLRSLRDNMVIPGKHGHGEFKLKVAGYYQELQDVRAEIISKLWEIHEERRLHWDSGYKKF